MELESPDSTLLPYLAQVNIFAKHVFAGVDYQDLQTDPHSPTQWVGTGPFKLTNFVPAQYVTLTAHKAYHLAAPYIQNWTMNYYGPSRRIK